LAAALDNEPMHHSKLTTRVLSQRP
jgi:hypothetical protein